MKVNRIVEGVKRSHSQALACIDRGKRRGILIISKKGKGIAN
jgi:hypothetical protein